MKNFHLILRDDKIISKLQVEQFLKVSSLKSITGSSELHKKHFLAIFYYNTSFITTIIGSMFFLLRTWGQLLQNDVQHLLVYRYL